MTKFNFYLGITFMHVGSIMIAFGFSRNPIIFIPLGLALGIVTNVITGGYSYKKKKQGVKLNNHGTGVQNE